MQTPAIRRLEYAGSVEEAAREADLVIEAVPEEMESKIEIFTLLDKICRPTHDAGLEYFVAQRHRDCQRHLSRARNAWACTSSIPFTR